MSNHKLLDLDFSSITKENQIIDHSDFGNNGTVKGEASVVADPDFGYALNFDGEDDTVEVPSKPNLQLTGDVTAAVWVQFTELSSDWVCLLGKGHIDDRTFVLWCRPHRGYWMFQHRVPGGSGARKFAHIRYTNPGEIELFRWYHFAGVREEKKYKLFLDGVLVHETTFRQELPTASNHPVRVGYFGVHNHLKGKIARASIFNRALTGDDIRREMLAKNSLVVPLHLKGIYVDKTMNTVGPTADFTYLPWNDGQRDYNPDYAPLGEYLETEPMQSANGELQPGIHLHWTLPPALCRAVKANNGNDQYPFVPVKWNIVPVDTNKLKAKTLWSDYLHPEDTWINLNYASVPVPYLKGHAPYRYMGKATNLGAGFSEGDHYSGENYLNAPLTCMGYGSLSFASFYPDGREVFGHHEPLENVTSLDSATYFVNALLYKEGDNTLPLNQLMQATDLSLIEVLRQFEWTLSKAGNLPKEIYLAGAVKINTAQTAEQAMASTAGALDFSLGNTGTEALSALLAKNIGQTQASAKKIEEQLEAILMQEKIQGQGADLGLKFLDARHDRGFRKLRGGSRWNLQPFAFGPDTGELFKARFLEDAEKNKLITAINRDITALEAEINVAEDDEKAGIQTQIDRKNRQKEWLDHLAAICDQLIQLNIDQHNYEVQHRKLKSMQAQLFSDWYKYMLAKYPPPESLEVFETSEWPDAGEVAAWLQYRALAIIDQGNFSGTAIVDSRNSNIQAAASDGADSSSKTLEQQWTRLKGIQQRQTDGAPNTKLIHQPAAPFYLPKEPVLLISGLNIPDPSTHQPSPEVDHYIDPDFLEGKTGKEKEKALFEKLFPDAAEVPENDPWNPFILEWEAEFLPLVDTNAKNAPQNRFTLGENKPDTELVVPESYKNVHPVVIRGRTFLTPGAKARKKAVLKEFLKLKLPRTAVNADGESIDLTQKDLTSRVNDYIAGQHKPYDTNNAVLTAAKAYQELDNMIVLSQALSGFNDALLQMSHHIQSPLYDPLAAEDENNFSQLIGQLVGNQIKGAPNPANPFLPARAGSLRLIGIRLIDAWGRFRDLLNGNQNVEPVLPQTLKPYSSKPGWAGLPLRVSQPLRLHFDWLAAKTYQGQEVSLDQIPFASPILGWFVANHLDRNLMYFDAAGNALGYYNRQAEHAQPPGVNGVSATPPHVQHLLDHVHGNPAWMQAFLDATDDAFSHIAPNDNLLHSGIAMLTGKPMAVVRVRLRFELMGSPAQNHSWNVLKAHVKQLKSGGPQPENQWQKMKFPVRLGNYMKLNDGLIGFWVEDGEGQLQGPLYTMASQTNRSDLLPHNKETLIWLPLDGQSVTLTLLMDPRAAVHATSGILPVKSLKLRTELYTEAVGRLSSWFLNAPLLQPKDASSILYTTPPEEPGYQWSWVEAANDHNQKGIDPKWKEFNEFLRAEEKANLEKDSELKEGWLKLNHQ